MIDIISKIPLEFCILTGLFIGAVIGHFDANMMSREVDRELEAEKQKYRTRS